MNLFRELFLYPSDAGVLWLAPSTKPLCLLRSTDETSAAGNRHRSVGELFVEIDKALNERKTLYFYPVNDGEAHQFLGRYVEMESLTEAPEWATLPA